MSFFDTTPMGRIINRFTKDTDVLDNEIAEQARLCCFGFGNMCGILIMCCIFLPWFAIAVPFLGVYVCCCFNYYQSTAREVKRIEGTSRSLVFSSFDESLQGMSTIKLYASSDRFIDKNTKLINTMNEAYLFTVSVQRWFAMALHGCSASVNIIICMLSVSRSYPISAASSGLLISYIVQLSMQLISFSKSLGQVEQYSSSIERVCEYVTELPQEAAYVNESEDAKIPENWPADGRIVFKDVSLKYRPELPFVLKNMNLDIKPGEKIGICGRTGAGKSTIMTALYRLSEIADGQMTIDGVDISKIGLYQLRSHLAIIPQDPVLFRGTIRRNLDPFGEADDSVLQKAIDLACGTQNDSKFDLDTFVEDDGVNFSLGERQVIALCRALIRKSKILILDEATSSVDYETDARIQTTIAEGFKHCTILCIAHRLKTILNYDRILVMDKGECAEFDTPMKLWRQNGIFRSMCDKSGIEEGDFE
jgi:ATP-binding cassette, subfamily C (CFTR/MRP), member 1